MCFVYNEIIWKHLIQKKVNFIAPCFPIGRPPFSSLSDNVAGDLPRVASA